MSASSNPPGPSPYGYDAARRRSLNGASPPNPFAGEAPLSCTQLQAASQPNLLVATTHMPPPSSPPQQNPHAMSISSLIAAQTSQSQTSPPTNAPTSNGQSMQPPSPRRALPSGPRSDFAPFRRPSSPERALYGGSISRPSDGHPFPAGSPTQRPYSNHGSPDLGRQSLPPSTQSYQSMGFPGQRMFASSDASRQSSGSVPARPTSQPTGPPRVFEQEGRSTYDSLGGRRSMYGLPEERRRTLGESHHARPNTMELLGGARANTSERDRAVTVHPVSQSIFSPPQEHQGIPGSTDAARSLWRHAAPSDAFREAADSRREEPPPLNRNYGPYPSPALGGHRYGGQITEDALRRSVDHLSNRVVEQYHAPPTSDPNSMERHRTEPLARSFSSGGRSSFEGPPKMGEAMQHSKSHIGFGLDANRRTGRASPLPQAVQGAQAQPISIGKDPGIKSEFGRMFSGLGSGLGSSTPSRGSPMPQNGSFSHDPETGEMLRLQRVNSQQGRKPKRVKDEEGIFDIESTDGRATPSGARGAKRNKHHHHHAPHHQ